MLTPDFAKIPPELRARRQWVLWKIEPGKDGKMTKVPYNPANPRFKASSTKPHTWGTFAQAVAAAQTDGFSGIGFMFSENDPYAGIDLDHCRDPESGEIAPWAWEIINRFDSYTEISPSGKGIHILIRGKLPQDADHQKNLEGGGKIEIYDCLRYFTITGNIL